MIGQPIDFGLAFLHIPLTRKPARNLEPTMTTFAQVICIRNATRNYWLPAQEARDLYIAGLLGMHRADNGTWNYCSL